MQKMMHKLHYSRQIYKEKMESQRQSFQIKLEQIGEKIELLKVISKILKKKVRPLRLLGQLAAWNFLPPAKVVIVFINNNLDKRAKRQIEEQRFKNESQE